VKGLSDTVVAIIIIAVAVVITLIVVTLTFNVLSISSSSLQVAASPIAKVWKVDDNSYNVSFTLMNGGIETSIVNIMINDNQVTIISASPSYYPKVPPGKTTYTLQVTGVVLKDQQDVVIKITLGNNEVLILRTTYTTIST